MDIRFMKVLLLTIILFSVSVIYADEYLDGLKKAEMENQAAQYRTESGFVGTVKYNIDNMVFKELGGYYPNLRVSSTQDTASIRTISETIVDNLSGYLRIPREQLKLKHNSGITVRYFQEINGIGFDDIDGRLEISYEVNKSFTLVHIISFLHNTPDLSTQTKIDKQKAVEIMHPIEIANNPQRPIVDFFQSVEIPWAELKYINYGSRDMPKIQLCWIVQYLGYRVEIDAITGETMRHYSYSKNEALFHLKEEYTDTPIPHAFTSMTSEYYNVTGFSDCNGNLTLDEVDPPTDASLIFSKLSHDNIHRAAYTAHVYGYGDVYNNTTLNPGNPITDIVFNWDGGHTSKIYIDADKFFKFIETDVIQKYNPVDPFNFVNTRIWSTNPTQDWWGQYTAGNPQRIDVATAAGFYKNVICHEVTHALVNNKAGFNFNPTGNPPFSANDEAYGVYYSCSSFQDPVYRLPNHNQDLNFGFANFVFDFDSNGYITEHDYSYYNAKYSIASTLWSIRNDLSVDSVNVRLYKILDVIGQYISYNEGTKRDRARFLYNCLMRMYNQDPFYKTTTAQQNAITSAFEQVGMFFKPLVTSCDEYGTREKNSFKNGETLRIKVEKCVQNTPIKVYIVPHLETPYIEGQSVPSVCLIEPISGTDVHTNGYGYWMSDPITLSLSANNNGAYGFDIIVDVDWNDNLPENSDFYPNNNGKIRYKYSGIQDGIDGIGNPGFVINVQDAISVMALDNSGSMLNKYGTTLHPMFLVGAKAAKECTDLMELETRMGIVHFNKRAFKYDFDGLSLRRLINDWAYNNVKYAIDQHLNDNYTNIRDACDKSFETFVTQLYNPLTTSTLIITDGQHCVNPNFEYDPNDNCSSPFPNYNNTARLYVLLLGNPGIEKFRNLDYLVKERKGEVFWGLTWPQLLEGENSYLEHHNYWNTTNKRSGVFTGFDSTIETIDFNADSKIYDININLLTTISNNNMEAIIVSILDPENHEYTINETNDDIVFTTTDDVTKVCIKSPQSGIWQIRYEQNPQCGDEVSYSISTYVSSDYIFYTDYFPLHPYVGSGITFLVNANNRICPALYCDVKLEITSPEEVTYYYQLYDDGLHSDGLANDGIYGFTFCDNTLEGKYKIKYQVKYPENSSYVFRQSEINNLPGSLFTHKIHKDWNWIGFPVIPRDSFDEVNAQDFLYPGLPYITHVMSQTGDIVYDGFECHEDTIGMINSVEGYKIKSTDCFDLTETGTIVDTTQAIDILNDNWYWLCYPKKTRLEPEEIFADALSCFDHIMAEEWSMKKENGVWIEGDNSSKPMLEYGDAFVAHAIQDAVLYWSPLSVSKPQVIRVKPQNYLYEIKPEYETVMIDSIYGNPQFDEIGVFYNNECKGASVMEGYPIQILVYTPNDSRDNEPYEFRLYDDSRCNISFNQILYNSDYQDDSLFLYPSPLDFRVVKLLNPDIVPPVVTLSQNYPNPFNPVTSVRFSLPVKTQVKLRIYNIKGQLVKELVNGDFEKGFHTINWDGRNQQDKSAGSGLYLIRLETGEKVIIKKAMMLK